MRPRAGLALSGVHTARRGAGGIWAQVSDPHCSGGAAKHGPRAQGGLGVVTGARNGVRGKAPGWQVAGNLEGQPKHRVPSAGKGHSATAAPVGRGLLGGKSPRCPSRSGGAALVATLAPTRLPPRAPFLHSCVLGGVCVCLGAAPRAAQPLRSVSFSSFGGRPLDGGELGNPGSCVPAGSS